MTINLPTMIGTSSRAMRLKNWIPYLRIKGLDTFAQYKNDLLKLGTFDFADYKSSRYFAMGTDLYKHLFGSDPG